jgi:hypothetical protein
VPLNIRLGNKFLPVRNTTTYYSKTEVFGKNKILLDGSKENGKSGIKSGKFGLKKWVVMLVYSPRTKCGNIIS